jgi:hypothetical protein
MQLYKHLNLTKHKTFEFQLDLFDKGLAPNFFDFDMKWTTKQDHAGPSITISVFYLFYFHIMIYDNRHWNYETGTWEADV